MIAKRPVALYRLSLIAGLLAIVVVMVGAYTRLVDAGLGCPDWPACYGHFIVPEQPQAIAAAEQAYPDRPVETNKAWTEMAHRYLASTLGFLILILTFLALQRRRRDANQPVALPLMLLAVVIFQGLLGMWTVTLLLQPTIVMGHLMGGLTTLSLLWLLMLHHHSDTRVLPDRYFRLRGWGMLGLLFLVIQIFLGGWTSANYAGIACPDFPYCQGQLWPTMHWKEAFNLWPHVGPDYQGGLLPNPARVTINTVHRFFGMFTGLYLMIYSIVAATLSGPGPRRALGIFLLIGVITQVIVGILNVVWKLPIGLAVAHNGIAAILLITLITLLYRFYRHPWSAATIIR